MIVKCVQKASDVVDKYTTVVTVMLLGGMTIITTAQIIFRVFFTALIWSEELARYMLVWLTFFGAGCVHKRAGHIAVNFLQELLPFNMRKVFQVVAQLLCITVFGIMIYYGFWYMQLMGNQLSAAMRIPMRYMYTAIPVGGIILLLHSLSRLTLIIAQKEAGAE